MGLLDFIKNREGQRPAAEQQSQQQQPETYKQSMTRQDAEDSANPKPILLNDKDTAAVKDANDLFRKSSKINEQPAPASAPTPTDGATDPQQPMVQPSMNQDKAAPSLSPTSAQAGAKEHEQEAPANVSPSPTPSPRSPRNSPSIDR